MCGTIAGAASILFKFMFVVSGVFILIGSSMLWARNPYNLEGEPLSRFKYDVFSFWLSWSLCFLAFILKETAFVVLTAGVMLASSTYRKDSNMHGNLCSVASLNMCNTFVGDNGNSANTASYFDPDYSERNALTGYTYSMSKQNAIYCSTGLSFMYTGLLIALWLATWSGKKSREDSPFLIRLLGGACTIAVIIGVAVILSADAAKLKSSTYATTFDQAIIILLVGIYVGLAYMASTLPLVYASALMAAYTCITNLSTMWQTTGTTHVDIANVQSGFIIAEAAMIFACVLCLLNAEIGGGAIKNTKVVPVITPVASPAVVPKSPRSVGHVQKDTNPLI